MWRTGRARLAVWGIPLLALASATAVQCVGEDPDTPAAATPDAGTDTFVAEDAPQADGPCAAIYVAANGGADTNDGCSSTTPKKTIVSAVRSAKTNGAKKVLVCEGTYTEDQLVVDFGVSLEGGYDCNTWQRVPDASLRDGNRTTIVNGNYGATGATVTLRGSALTREHVFEGFTVRGGDANDPSGASATKDTSAISVDSASVRIVRVSANGGVASERTVAIRLDRGAPEVAFSHVDGGRGKTSAANSAGSIGIDVRNGALAYLHDNVILGGNGEGQDASGLTRGSIGLSIVTKAEFSSAKGNPIERNEIRGGSGTGTSTGTIGVQIRGDQLYELLENVIDGGTGTYTGPAGGTAARGYGVEAYDGTGAATARIRLLRNRIYAGSTQGTGVGSRAVNISGYAVELSNNVVASSVTTNAGGAVVGPWVAARHNTFVGGPASGQGSLSISGTLNVVQNNLFLSRGDLGEPAMMLRTCASAGAVTVFENNAFAFAKGGVLGYATSGAGCTQGTTYATLDAAEAELALAPVSPLRISGNRRIAAPACVGGEGATCVDAPPCGDAGVVADCARGIFSSWKTDGIAELEDGGLPLKTGTYCALVNGGLDLRADAPFSFLDDGGVDAGAFLLGGVANDLNGAPRTPAVGSGISVGAHELEDATGCIP